MSLEEIKEIRSKKLDKVKKVFGQAYPVKIFRDFRAEEAVNNFLKLSRSRKPLLMAGRIFNIRSHGGVIFCDFTDGFGGRKEEGAVYLQAYLKKDIVGQEQFNLFNELADVGDFVEFKGSLFKTKKREKSIKVSSWKIISKSLRPLPEKWHGLSDVEERYRKRYLDLMMNKTVSDGFVLRSKIIAEIRNFLNKCDFVEVETPILQPIAGGASAEPFKTHHNALDMNLFLRIAPELYLKKLLIGGFEKVYEIGRNFRNEGIDVTHNPEFTMLEFYQAYKDAEFGRGFAEELIKNLVKKIFNKQLLEYEGHKVSFSKKFSVVSFYDVLKRHALINHPEDAPLEDFVLKARQFGIDVLKSDSKEKIADNIFKKVCRTKLIQPTFVIDYPIELFPLAKKKEDNSELADFFQLFVGGLELAKGYSELNNPLEQRERFKKQQELRRDGDREANEFDEDFIEAMEYGMPPACGVGIGIDRLAMFFLNVHNIRDAILFPTLRPK
ncbi:lysine--tRNA ligase [Patescibacteria group bacterium]|nr:lysine--tRNA ligase [Patescibacteria group bacterium]